jgi:ABC-type glycerol-3-phosphate transport system substrate-binding protein
MKRWLAVSCALVALLAVGASASSGKATASKADKTTITVWYWGVPDNKAMLKVDAAYMKAHPDITIKRVVQPGTTFPTLMRATVAARKGPDLFLSFASPYLFDYLPGVEPLDKLATAKDKTSLTGWNQVTTKNGVAQGVPFDANGTVFYYNKALFKKAGLDPNAPPKTWAQLLTACDKLKAAGITPINAGWKSTGYIEWWLGATSAQYQTDAEIAKAASGPNWGSPAISKALGLVQNLYKRGCFTNDSEAIPLFPTAVNNFKAGKGAMMIGLQAADVHWQQFRQTAWGKKNLGAFLTPLVPNSLWKKQRTQYSAATVWAVTRWSDHPKEAYDFALYMASKGVQEELVNSAGEFPVNKAARPKVADPVGAQILDWSHTTPQFANQFALIRATVEGVLLKYEPDLVTGKKSWNDISGQLKDLQAKGAQ